jgi:archaellum component FlaG (FlaF/FlaG flagellin family)
VDEGPDTNLLLVVVALIVCACVVGFLAYEVVSDHMLR